MGPTLDPATIISLATPRFSCTILLPYSLVLLAVHLLSPAVPFTSAKVSPKSFYSVTGVSLLFPLAGTLGLIGLGWNNPGSQAVAGWFLAEAVVLAVARAGTNLAVIRLAISYVVAQLNGSSSLPPAVVNNHHVILPVFATIAASIFAIIGSVISMPVLNRISAGLFVLVSTFMALAFILLGLDQDKRTARSRWKSPGWPSLSARQTKAFEINQPELISDPSTPPARTSVTLSRAESSHSVWASASQRLRNTLSGDRGPNVHSIRFKDNVWPTIATIQLLGLFSSITWVIKLVIKQSLVLDIATQLFEVVWIVALVALYYILSKSYQAPATHGSQCPRGPSQGSSSDVENTWSCSPSVINVAPQHSLPPLVRFNKAATVSQEFLSDRDPFSSPPIGSKVVGSARRLVGTAGTPLVPAIPKPYGSVGLYERHPEKDHRKICTPLPYPLVGRSQLPTQSERRRCSKEIGTGRGEDGQNPSGLDSNAKRELTIDASQGTLLRPTTPSPLLENAPNTLPVASCPLENGMSTCPPPALTCHPSLADDPGLGPATRVKDDTVASISQTHPHRGSLKSPRFSIFSITFAGGARHRARIHCSKNEDHASSMSQDGHARAPSISSSAPSSPSHHPNRLFLHRSSSAGSREFDFPCNSQAARRKQPSRDEKFLSMIVMNSLKPPHQVMTVGKRPDEATTARILEPTNITRGFEQCTVPAESGHGSIRATPPIELRDNDQPRALLQESRSESRTPTPTASSPDATPKQCSHLGPLSIKQTSSDLSSTWDPRSASSRPSSLGYEHSRLIPTFHPTPYSLLDDPLPTLNQSDSSVDNQRSHAPNVPESLELPNVEGGSDSKTSLLKTLEELSAHFARDYGRGEAYSSTSAPVASSRLSRQLNTLTSDLIVSPFPPTPPIPDPAFTRVKAHPPPSCYWPTTTASPVPHSRPIPIPSGRLNVFGEVIPPGANRRDGRNSILSKNSGYSTWGSSSLQSDTGFHSSNAITRMDGHPSRRFQGMGSGISKELQHIDCPPLTISTCSNTTGPSSTSPEAAESLLSDGGSNLTNLLPNGGGIPFSRSF